MRTFTFFSIFILLWASFCFASPDYDEITIKEYELSKCWVLPELKESLIDWDTWSLTYYYKEVRQVLVVMFNEYSEKVYEKEVTFEDIMEERAKVSVMYSKEQVKNDLMTKIQIFIDQRIPFVCDNTDSLIKN